jgi:hypothetical protein
MFMIAGGFVLLVLFAACINDSDQTPRFLQGEPGEVDEVFRPILSGVDGEAIVPANSSIAESGSGSYVFVGYEITARLNGERDYRTDLAKAIEANGASVDRVTGDGFDFSVDYSGLSIGSEIGDGTVRADLSSIRIQFSPVRHFDDSAGATEIVQTENQRFIEEHPEIVHDHPPLVCEGGVPTLGCSEAYYHKDELERRDWHVKQAWTESIMECGTQRDVLHADDRYPVGHRIVTYKDCNEDEFITATPTTGPSRQVE